MATVISAVYCRAKSRTSSPPPIVTRICTRRFSRRGRKTKWREILAAVPRRRIIRSEKGRYDRTTVRVVDDKHTGDGSRTPFHGEGPMYGTRGSGVGAGRAAAD